MMMKVAICKNKQPVITIRSIEVQYSVCDGFGLLRGASLPTKIQNFARG